MSITTTIIFTEVGKLDFLRRATKMPQSKGQVNNGVFFEAVWCPP